MNRILLLTLGAVAAFAAFAALAAAASAPTAMVSGKPVAINPTSKRFTIGVSCTSEADPCTGVLDVKTAGKIKPYSSSPAAVAKVGTFPFSIPAGATAQVSGRVYGPALAQAMLRGRVMLSITPRSTTALTPVAAKTVVFTYRRP